MKHLSLIALAGAFALTLAAGGTAFAKPKFTCCNPKECLTLVLIQNAGAADLYRFHAQSRCMQCRYPYQDRCCD
jgi:hypothetical protein